MTGWNQIFQERRLAVRDRTGVNFSVTRAYPTHRVRRTDGDDPRLELNFPALYGPFAALPDYFTDELLLEGEDREAMRAFLDLFNARLFELLYQVWSRYRLFIEDPLQGDTVQGKRESRMLGRLMGKLSDRDEPLYLKGLRKHKLGLFRKSARTSAGLLELLNAFFPDLEIELEQFVAQYRDIPEEQRSQLGVNTQIGAEGTTLAGRRIKDISGGFRLFFKDLDYESFMKLSPGGRWRDLLKTLVGDYTRNRLDCLIRLELKATEVPAWRMEPSQNMQGARLLGRNMWLKSQPLKQAEVVDAGGLS